MTTASRGAAAERAVCRLLEERGWWTMRSPASKGAVDVVALSSHGRWSSLEGTKDVLFTLPQPWHVQVKTTARSALADFGPAQRRELFEEAWKAGALPVLAWKPPGRGQRWRFWVVTADGLGEEIEP